jgi:hypothetical protein
VFRLCVGAMLDTAALAGTATRALAARRLVLGFEQYYSDWLSRQAPSSRCVVATNT